MKHSQLGTHLFLREFSGEVAGGASEERHKVGLSWPTHTSGQRETNQAYLQFWLESSENPLPEPGD